MRASYLFRSRWNGSYDTHEIPQIKPESVSGHRVSMEIIIVLCDTTSAQITVGGNGIDALSFSPRFMLISLLSLSQIAWPGCTGVQSNSESSKLYASGDAMIVMARVGSSRVS
jgi:hypothetical protein